MKKVRNQGSRLAVLGVLILGSTAPGHAQDVELLGRHHGTRPPASYYEEMLRDPAAFSFGARAFAPALRPGDDVPGPLLDGRGRSPGVTGTYRFPLLLLQFSDSPDSVDYVRDRVQAEYFDGPNSRGATIPDFYGEISGGRVTLVGETLEWSRSTLSQVAVSGNVSGLAGSARVGDFVIEGLAAADAGTDWGRFDNDGPDGVPNSGDDDGFVDVLAVMHPTSGAECDGDDESDRIWSHRWTLSAAAGGPYVTSTPSASTSNPRPSILVDNYTIQPVLACEGGALNEIGVFAHELGHGFGLPDLYAVGDFHHAGIGRWGLMGSGAWGCDGASPERPCHLMAWSKAVLGWVDVVDLAPGLDHGLLTLPPVESGDRVYRVEGPGTDGAYLLLENRQPMGFDQGLIQPGLLIWQIDPQVVATRWSINAINSNRHRMGVWLREGDGRNDLATPFQGRGDPGDPFPGSARNTAFHAGSAPASVSHDGDALGVTVLDIETAGEDVDVRLLTYMRRVTVRVVGSTKAGLVTLGGVSLGPVTAFDSAPYEPHVLIAAGGDSIGPGLRKGFSGWEDGSDPERVFVTTLTDSTLTASYGSREVRIDVELQSPVPGVAPGRVSTSPGSEDGWVTEGALAVISAEAQLGFGFIGWSGALAGMTNPATVQADGPVTAGATFEVLFSVSDNPATLVFRPGVEDQAHRLRAQHANKPVTWVLQEGALPSGVLLAASGRLEGAPLDLGEFLITVAATDALGLEAETALSIQVPEPAFPVSELVGPFVLTGVRPSDAVKDYMDHVGNRNGIYDLGDFRAYILGGGAVTSPAAGGGR